MFSYHMSFKIWHFHVMEALYLANSAFVSRLYKSDYLAALEYWIENVELIDLRWDEHYEAGYLETLALHPLALEIAIGLGARPTIARDHLGNTALEYLRMQFPLSGPDSQFRALMEESISIRPPIQLLHSSARDQAGNQARQAFLHASNEIELDKSFLMQREMWQRLADCTAKLPELQRRFDIQCLSRDDAQRRTEAAARASGRSAPSLLP